jgi:hypothetical protein
VFSQKEGFFFVTLKAEFKDTGKKKKKKEAAGHIFLLKFKHTAYPAILFGVQYSPRG